MAAVPVSARDPRISALLSTRTPSGSLLAEGVWAHECLRQADVGIDVLVTCPDLLEPAARRLANDLTSRARTAVEVSVKTYSRITRRTKPSGLASLVRLPRWRADDVPVDPSTRVLVADGIEYATNLGALIRVIDASGAKALLITNRQARLEHPDVFTASRGTLLTTPVVDFGPPAAAADWLLRTGFTIRLALPGAAGGWRSREDGPTAIVVGSEGRGVSPEWLSVPHEPVSIPMRGRADSLNVAVAAGVLLFG